MLECVANVSEGRDARMLDALSAACGPALLDRHVDADHHRSVFTLAGPGEHAAEEAARALARAVAALVDLHGHHGVHPRLGALDVVPFVPLDEPMAAAAGAAQAFAAWIARELGVPTFLYDAADPLGRSLPALRRDAFHARGPDHGPDAPHPHLGAVAVGARRLLVAVNCWLASGDATTARAVAAAVRERDGGLPGVRALGFGLPRSRGAQVSMNLVDLERTGIEAACTEVRDRAAAVGDQVTRVELVGLLPAAELERTSPEFRAWARLDADRTIEARLARSRE